MLLALSLSGAMMMSHAADPVPPTGTASDDIEVPAGWYYYDGDEFNGVGIDKSYWGLYGDQGVGQSTYGQPQMMTQTYRPSQVSIIKDGDISFARIHATREGNPPTPSKATTKNGWWSGALSSRDTGGYGFGQRFYPLFARYEIRAKVPFHYGVWMALWLRFFQGASVAELDLEEFFCKYYETTQYPYQVNQTVHMYNSSTGNTDVNINGYNRYVRMKANPGADYHVYGVQIDPDPIYPTRHAVVSFLLDGQITSTWKTSGTAYNSFVLRAISQGREMTAWDIAITGQIGGPDNYGLGYPEDRDPNLRDLYMDIDWVRVFTRANYHEPTAVKSVESASLLVSGEKGNIEVTNNGFSGDLCVYSSTGRLVEKTHVDRNDTSLKMPSAGLYLVKAGDRSYKVLVSQK